MGEYLTCLNTERIGEPRWTDTSSDFRYRIETVFMNTRRNQINFPINFFAFGEFREHLALQFFSKRHAGIYAILDEVGIENLDFFVRFGLFFDRNFIRNCLGIRC